MPVAPHRSASALDTLQAIQDAFDEACRESLVAPVVSIDRQGARNRIVTRIIAAVLEDGERDPDRLKAYALEGFSL